MSSSASPSLDAQLPRSFRRTYNTEIQHLFLDIAKRIDQNSIDALKKFIPIDEIAYEINDVEPILLVQYIKQITFYLSKMKMEYEDRLLRLSEEEEQQSYESIIQKLEAEIRQHIRIEQQQRLHIENLQQKVEEMVIMTTQLENDLTRKNQELASLIQRFDKKDNRRVVNLYEGQQQPNLEAPQLPSTSNISSVPSSLQRRKSGSAAADKLSELISSEKQRSKSKNRSTNSSSVQQLPLQLQALFNKVIADRESQSRQSKRSASRNGMGSKYINETKSYETNNDSKSQYKEPSENRHLVSKHSQKESGQLTNRTVTQGNVMRTLEHQFIDADGMRDELTRQYEQQQIEAYLSHRDHSNEHSDLNKLKKALITQQKSGQKVHRKVDSKQELSKSSSFDGTSKIIRMYKREGKPQGPVNYLNSQKQFQQVNAILRKKHMNQ